MSTWGTGDEIEIQRNLSLVDDSNRQFASFLDLFHKECSEDHLAGFTAARLVASARSLFEFALERGRDEVKVRCRRRPFHAEPGLSASGLCLEMVADDMAHIVESTLALLRRRGLGIDALVHPVIRVTRDRDGILSSLHAANQRRGHPESFVRIDIVGTDGLSPQALADEVTAMMGQLRLIQQGAAACTVALSEAQAALEGDGAVGSSDSARFLGWLEAGNFIFAGSLRIDGVGAPVGAPAGMVRDEAMVPYLPAIARQAVASPDPVVAKLPLSSPVNGLTMMDCVAVSVRGPTARIWVFLGHFSATALAVSPRQVPVISDRTGAAMAALGFSPFSHKARTAAAIAERLPRDLLFTLRQDELRQVLSSVLALQDNQRAGLSLHCDPLGLFVTALVTLPAAGFDTTLEGRVCQIVGETLGGTMMACDAVTTDAVTRLHALFHLPNGLGGGALTNLPAVAETLRYAIEPLTRTWHDQLRRELFARLGDSVGAALWQRYRQGFSVHYRGANTALAAVDDIALLERSLSDGLACRLAPIDVRAPSQAVIKVARSGTPLYLFDVLPILEKMGARVVEESSFELSLPDAPTVWLHDIGVALDTDNPGARAGAFAQLFDKVWRGEVENDGLNALVFSAGLEWWQISVVRAYTRYLKQVSSALGLRGIEAAVVANPGVAEALVHLFSARFDPAGTPRDGDGAEHRVMALLDQVVDSEHDRVLRRLLNLILATVRTNAFVAVRDCLSFKVRCCDVEGMPAPRPLFEIFVYSPRVEGIHLRGGKVARGGLRWSNRREDFRTEILGLMKAQMVKNAVIVPVGSKGGFVLKGPLALADGGKRQEEAQACYRIFISGLLDVTDNLVGDTVVPPDGVIRYDGDDPYLVVAADKGTATFSDLANQLALDRGFWLGDAFASGGSHGYDHKVMGITARGAWESVKRHFQEMGRDCQTTPLTVVGIGDMSGDVFGNGMLQSRSVRLVAAFNHEHIFLDPDPDPARSYEERQRLFALPRSSWDDYDRQALSAGGGIWRRDAKTITVSAVAAAMLGIPAAPLPPDELIRAILMAPVDLLFMGGIGTYVRASTQAQAEVGDRSNDAIRVTASNLRCKVIAEGANLGLTQAARVEYALAGGRLNTDAVDNSAGVDCSDHEVNIKILLASNGAAEMSAATRDALLRDMTDDVAEAVLQTNRQQTAIISLIERAGAARLDRQIELMRLLERNGRLDRAIEGLPDGGTLAARQTAGHGLTRPEISVLMAYGKNWLADELLESDLPDDCYLAGELARYFPARLRGDFAAAIGHHRLAREIVAMTVANDMANHLGPASVRHLADRAGVPVWAVAKAYMAVRDVVDLPAYWSMLDDPHHGLSADRRYGLADMVILQIEEAIRRLLRAEGAGFDLATFVSRHAPVVPVMRSVLTKAGGHAGAGFAARVQVLENQNVPSILAQETAILERLALVRDIGDILRTLPEAGAEEVCRHYLESGDRLGLEWLRQIAGGLPVATPWQQQAVAGLIDEFHAHQRILTTRVVARAPGGGAVALSLWLESNAAAVSRIDRLVGEFKAAGTPDLAMLMVASREIASLEA